MTRYRIVQMIEGRLQADEVAEENLGARLDVRGLKIEGVNSNKWQRPELQGHPMIDKLVGPMWDGNGVIRYEDWEAYERLSK